MATYSTTRGVGIERAYHHWRERGALLDLLSGEADKPALTVAISRECGAGAGEIAAELSAALEWPVYDRELIDKIAEDSGIRLRLLEQLDEKRPNWLTECLEGLQEKKPLSRTGFALKLREVLLALYCHGNCIIIGRGAAQVLPVKRTLRVRLVAPLLDRVQRTSDHLGISNDAQKRVNEIDRQRTEFVQKYFHKDPSDVHDYDLTLNTARFTTEQCSELILTAVAARQAHLKAKC